MTQPAGSVVRVIGYRRLSQVTESSTSLLRQRELIEAECARRGWLLVDSFEDANESASTSRLDRPGLDALRAAVAGRRADVVLTWRVDRIARSVGDLCHLAEEFSGHGAALVSATEPFDLSTPMGKAMMQLLGVFAELEAATIRERVLAGRAKLREVGRFAGGRVPIGYRGVPHPSGSGRALEIDPDEAEILREVIAGILTGGSRWAALLRLNGPQGIRPRLGDQWTPASLKAVLTGVSILGQASHAPVIGKQKGADGRMRNVRGPKTLVRDPDGTPTQFAEPVITAAESATLRQIYARGAVPGVKTSRSKLLSALVCCGGCHGTLTSTGVRVEFSYRCKNLNCPKPTGALGSAIDAWISGEFLARYGDQQRFTVWTESGRPPRLDTIDAEIVGAAREMTAAIVTGDQDAENRLRGYVDKLRQERATEAAKVSSPRLLYKLAGDTYAEAWAAGDVAARRALLESVIEKFELGPAAPGRRGFDPDRADIRWSVGPTHALTW